MKKTYTAPEVTTFENNSIGFSEISEHLEDLRIIKLEGVPLRIEINCIDKYINVSSYEEVDISNHLENLKKLYDLFYSDAYIYAYLKDNKLKVYDIYINKNFLSYKDMYKLIKYYNLGFELAETLFNGRLNFKTFTTIANEVEDEKTLFILPSVYIDDTRFTASVKKSTSKVIDGTKKTYSTYSGYSGYSGTSYNKKTGGSNDASGSNGYYGYYGYYNDWFDDLDDYGYSYSHNNTGKSNVNKTDYIAKPAVYNVSTKKSRETIYKETLKNVTEFVEKNKKTLSANALEYWKKYGKKAVYYYSIYTLPETRNILYKHSESTFCWWVPKGRKDNTIIWATVITDKISVDFCKLNYGVYDTDYFCEILQEELKELDKFYEKEFLEKNPIFDFRKYVGEY